MVIMSMETFEGISERLKMYQSLMISEEQMKEGKVKDARASLASSTSVPAEKDFSISLLALSFENPLLIKS